MSDCTGSDATAATASGPDGLLPVDGHVHLHQPERAAALLDAALANFDRLAAMSPDSRQCIAGMLLLTEASEERGFATLQGASRHGAWRLEPCYHEAHSLLAHRSGRTIIVVAGRQLRCRGGLEVAALGTTERFADGLPLAEAIGNVQASGALAVLPWGFGKWWGRRGRIVRAQLAMQPPDALMLGDNAGRLGMFARPALLQDAEAAGFKVLPGTDPFPFSDDFRRVGSFGFVADTRVDPASPWKSLFTWLINRGESPRAYGVTMGLPRFISNNVRIQLRRVRRRLWHT